MENESFTYNATKKALDKNEFEKVGYIFSGWNTDPQGLGIAFEDQA
jgi:hypothetical protein